MSETGEIKRRFVHFAAFWMLQSFEVRQNQTEALRSPWKDCHRTKATACKSEGIEKKKLRAFDFGFVCKGIFITFADRICSWKTCTEQQIRSFKMTNPAVTLTKLPRLSHLVADRALQFEQKRKKTQWKTKETFEINSLSVQVETNNMDQWNLKLVLCVSTWDKYVWGSRPNVWK